MKNFLFVFVYMLFLNSAHSQTTVIDALATDTMLSYASSLEYDRILNLDEYSSVHLIEVNTLASSLDTHGNLVLDVDGVGCTPMKFTPRVSEFISESQYKYHAAYENPDTSACECIDGELVLISRGDRKYGTLRIDKNTYDILAVGENYAALCLVDSNLITSYEISCETEFAEEELKVKEPVKKAVELRTGESCLIRVLFLYDPAAVLEYGEKGLYDRANTAITLMNLSMNNTGYAGIEFKIANTRIFTGFAQTNDAGFDRNNLATDLTVEGWRTEDLADVVCLIPKDVYKPSIYQQTWGLSMAENLLNPQGEYAYFLACAPYLNSQLVFQHEMGHTMGVLHQHCNTTNTNHCDNQAVYAHGYKFWHFSGFNCYPSHPKLIRYFDIMHVPGTGVKMLRFSNPDLVYLGHPTGTVLSDIARWFDDYGCNLSSYTDEPVIPLKANIVGPKIICEPNEATYTANIAIGINPTFTYQWHVSDDGANWDDYGTSSSIYIDPSNFDLKDIVHVRLKVTDNLGNFIWSFFQMLIVAENSSICEEYEFINNNLNNGSVSNAELHAFPNPLSDELNIEFEVPHNNSNVKIELYNNLGTKVKEMSSLYSKGSYQYILKTSDIGNGIIYLVFSLDGHRNYIKLVKM